MAVAANSPAASAQSSGRNRRDGISFALVTVTVTVTALAATLALVGADARWLAALGALIAHRGAVPAGVPFASAPTGHWPNPIVVAQLVFHWLEAGFGDRGLMLAQLTAVAVAVAVLFRDATAGGATPQGTVPALLLGVGGALPALAIIRVQLFSLALFPLTAALLRSEARTPSNRIWLLVPLVALWSNLHGAALTGLGMVLAYLVLARLRQQPWTAVAVAASAALALCLTPAGIHTISYYHGVLTNEAAQRGEGLWAPLSLTAPLDVLLIACTMALGARLARSRVELWELAVLAVLAVLTIKASRSGVWLIFFLVPLAARAFRRRELWDRLLPAVATVSLLLLVIAVIRGPLPSGAPAALIHRAIVLSRGRPVLAEDVFAEQIALAGGRITVANPIDAFSPQNQDRYLDWLEGKPSGRLAIDASVDVVLTGRSSSAQRLMQSDPAFRLVARNAQAALFVR